MARVDPFSALYCKKVSALDFKWDTMVAPPLLSLISPQDIYALNQIAMSNKLASDPDEKYKRINNILVPRGFKKIASGTNRVAYKYLENQDLCLKVAFDRVGLKDNPAEFQNQFKLKPFVVRLFEISPCGTVALEERVEPLVHIEEYANIIDDVFNFIVEKIIGKYVVDDIGTEYWQNIGIRKGFGPVLLDFPYVYELDGAKIHCNWMNPDTHTYCLGEIDYDDGFNHLVCSKCGKSYFAKQLAKQVKNHTVIVEKKGEIPAMSIRLVRGNETIRVIETQHESATITPPAEEQPSVNIRLKNKSKFDQREKDRKKIQEANKEAMEDASKRYDKRMDKQVKEGLQALHEGSSGTQSAEANVRDVTLSELTGKPNCFEGGRFELAGSVSEIKKEEPPTREVDVSKQDDTLTAPMGDLIKKALDGVSLEDSKPDDEKSDIEVRGETEPINDQLLGQEVVVEAPVEKGVPVDDPKDENVKYIDGKKYTKVEVNTTEKSNNTVSEDADDSSWDNPLKCNKVTIDIEDKDDEIMKMY